MKKVSLILFSLVLSISFTAGTTIMNYDFDNDNNGLYLSHPTQTTFAADSGSIGGTWSTNYGPRVQNGNLNVGYTSAFKWTGVDAASAVPTSHRAYDFTNAITSDDYTSFTMEVKIASYDFLRTWDTNSGSAQGKGVQFSLIEDGGNDTASIYLETQGTGDNIRVVSSSSGSGNITGAFTQKYGGAFATQLERSSTTGVTLQINGDLSTGLWSSRAKSNGVGDAWVDVITDGTGLTSIDKFRLTSRSPSTGSWGGAADPAVSQGDFALIDYMTITATPVPEASTYALILATAAFGFVAVRRRKS